MCPLTPDWSVHGKSFHIWKVFNRCLSARRLDEAFMGNWGSSPWIGPFFSFYSTEANHRHHRHHHRHASALHTNLILVSSAYLSWLLSLLASSASSSSPSLWNWLCWFWSSPSPPNVQLARCVLCTLPHVPPQYCLCFFLVLFLKAGNIIHPEPTSVSPSWLQVSVSLIPP